LLLPPSHLTPCPSMKSNLYFHSSFDTVISEPTLYYTLFRFHGPYLSSIFHCLGPLSKESKSKAQCIVL
jgi:hypothetical protein